MSLHAHQPVFNCQCLQCKTLEVSIESETQSSLLQQQGANFLRPVHNRIEIKSYTFGTESNGMQEGRLKKCHLTPFSYRECFPMFIFSFAVKSILIYGSLLQCFLGTEHSDVVLHCFLFGAPHGGSACPRPQKTGTAHRRHRGEFHLPTSAFAVRHQLSGLLNHK